MEGFLRVLKFVVIGFVSLLLILVLFLFLYYAHLARSMKDDRAERPVTPQESLADPYLPVDLPEQALNLLPVPKKAVIGEGRYQVPSQLSFRVATGLIEMTSKAMENLLSTRSAFQRDGADIRCRIDSSLVPQGYRLTLLPDHVDIEYSNWEGLYYALVTLRVLKHNYNNQVPCVEIEDWPDLAVRGLILDVSRDKVPTIETLLEMAQLLADMKYNQLELYMEGFSFAYPSFKNLWEGKETPLTGEEIKRLDNFCREHCIDLVPNQNSLGHMNAWLARDQFKDLAECPKGFKMMGFQKLKGTLDPSDPRSIDLVTRMSDDLLPNFSSGYFNVNLDEPFELGQGKSKKLVESSGLGQVYLDYVLKVHDMVLSRNKKMIMAGDIVLKHPEIISLLPSDIILLDWCYEAEYKFETASRKFNKANRDFMLCSGTSSWTSITGRSDNMIKNIENAAKNASRFGARGAIVTDWGDFGHWQYLPVSYAGFVTGGALNWNCNSLSELPLSTFLNTYIFQDEAALMGDFVLNMGRYLQYEEFQMVNMTTTMISLIFGLRDKVMVETISKKLVYDIADMMKEIDPELVVLLKTRFDNRQAYDFDGLSAFLDEQESVLENSKMASPGGELVKSEYHNAIRLISLGAKLKKYILTRDALTVKAELSELRQMQDLCDEFLGMHDFLWHARNKSGGYERSVKALVDLQSQIEKRMEILDRPTMARHINRFLEKVTTAGYVLYLRVTS